ncbi:MAG: hypothetical protein Q9219_004569 [cf. Caloplaca sp. 3 TL-2023]
MQTVTQVQRSVAPREVAHKHHNGAEQANSRSGGRLGRMGNHVVHYEIPDDEKAMNLSPDGTPALTVTCPGCSRGFKSYACMMLHLEEENCYITLAELGQLAESANQSKLFVLNGCHEYLRTQYGRERHGFDTDHDTNWQCVECKKIFHSLNQANKHAKSPVHKPRVLKCPVCQCTYSSVSGLLQHVESTACPEGLHRGTGALKSFLRDIEERVRLNKESQPQDENNSEDAKLDSISLTTEGDDFVQSSPRKTLSQAIPPAVYSSNPITDTEGYPQDRDGNEIGNKRLDSVPPPIGGDRFLLDIDLDTDMEIELDGTRSAVSEEDLIQLSP